MFIHAEWNSTKVMSQHYHYHHHHQKQQQQPGQAAARASFIMDRFHAMMKLESSLYYYTINESNEDEPHHITTITSSIMAGEPSSSSCSQYYSEHSTVSCWREKICYWAYGTVDYFQLSRKTVAICMNLFDRYLTVSARTSTAHFNNCCEVAPQEQEILTSRQLLLTSLTTLYIAIKLNEPTYCSCSDISSSSSTTTMVTNHCKKNRRKLQTITLNTVLQLCQKPKFQEQDIIEMEIKILHSLSWLVNPPTTVDFVADFLKFLPCSVPFQIRQSLFQNSRYMAELSICDPFFMDYLPSTIAFAAVANSTAEYLHEHTNATFIFYKHVKNKLGFCRTRYPIPLVREKLHDMLDAGDPFEIVDTSFSEEATSSSTRSSSSDSMKVSLEPEHKIVACK